MTQSGEKMAEEERSWYAFRSLRNGKKMFVELLQGSGREHFIPSLFPSLIFVRTDAKDLAQLRLRFYGLVFPYCEPGTTSPAAIRDSEMESFRFVLGSGYEYLEPCDINLCKGDKVRVTDGVFKGAEGYIARVKGDRRFIVKINGIVAVATMYIPGKYLEKL